MSARGGGSRIDTEVWQVQAYPVDGATVELTTFELVLDGDIWSVRSAG